MKCLNQFDDLSEENWKILEKLVVSVYSSTCNAETVNEVRRILFTRGNRAIENLPPASSSLKQHIKRSQYQAFVWIDLNAIQNIPNPNEWGWDETNDGFVPFWSELPELSKASRQIICCGCKKSCSGRCKCKIADLPCTKLCYCA